MSEPVVEKFDPHSLRHTIQIALGANWTKELEDELFWSVSAFCNHSCNLVRQDTLAKIHDALGITDKLQLASMGFPVT